LARGAEPSADVCPGVPERTKSVDGDLGHGVTFTDELEQVGETVDVSSRGWCSG
jgi:hypothetical protein